MRTAIFIFPFLILCFRGASLAFLQTQEEAKPIVDIYCHEKALDLIVIKLEVLNKKVDILEDLNKKVDILESKLTVMTAEKSNSKLSLDEIVENKVKDFHTQMTLGMVSQTVSAIKLNQHHIAAQIKSLNEIIIDQRENENIHLKTLKNVIEDWKTESTKVTDIIRNKIEFVLATEVLTNQDLHSLILKNGASDIKTATLKIDEDPEWIKKYIQDLNATIQENEKQISALNSTLNIDIHESLENQYLLEKKILKYLEDNISKNFTLCNQDLDREIRAIQNSIKTVIGTVNTLSDILVPVYSNCESALERTSMSGVYRLSIPNTDIKPFDAYCLEDEINGSNWTIIQRRQDGSVDFFRGWQDYKHGFGNPEGEYWLGLEKIYVMTSQQPHELWIELGDWKDKKRNAHYSRFEIGNESDKYFLKSVGRYSGNAKDALGPSDTMRKFTTLDADNDADDLENCAKEFHGAWWYDDCGWSDLNAQYNSTEYGRGVNWGLWHDFDYSLKYAHLAIRPVK